MPLTALFSVNVQLPEVSTVVVPRLVEPSNTVTLLLASAVPWRLIVLVVSTPFVSGVNDLNTGAAGGGGGGVPPAAGK